MLKTERRKEERGPVVRSIHRDIYIELQSLKISHTGAFAPGTCEANSGSTSNGATFVLWPSTEVSFIWGAVFSSSLPFSPPFLFLLLGVLPFVLLCSASWVFSLPATRRQLLLLVLEAVDVVQFGKDELQLGVRAFPMLQRTMSRKGRKGRCIVHAQVQQVPQDPLSIPSWSKDATPKAALALASSTRPCRRQSQNVPNACKTPSRARWDREVLDLWPLLQPPERCHGRYGRSRTARGHTGLSPIFLHPLHQLGALQQHPPQRTKCSRLAATGAPQKLSFVSAAHSRPDSARSSRASRLLSALNFFSLLSWPTILGSWGAAFSMRFADPASPSTASSPCPSSPSPPAPRNPKLKAAEHGLLALESEDLASGFHAPQFSQACLERHDWSHSAMLGVPIQDLSLEAAPGWLSCLPNPTLWPGWAAAPRPQEPRAASGQDRFAAAWACPPSPSHRNKPLLFCGSKLEMALCNGN